MKIALVITDGLEQFVLTPESDTETRLVDVLTSKDKHEVAIHRGSFYTCQGGWYRHGSGDESAIIVLTPKPSDDKSALNVIADRTAN